METIKTFWINLSKAQKIGVVAFLQIIFIAIMIVLFNFAIQPKSHVGEIVSEDEIGLPVPEKNVDMFKDALWGVISKNVKDVDQNVLNDVTIREGTYKEIEHESSTEAVFIIDIDSIKQSYTVSISWVAESGPGMYDNVSIECPPQNQMKYPETVCYGMYNNTYSMDLYLPYGVSPDVPENTPAAPHYYITGDEDEKTIDIMVSVCDVEKYKKEAMDYLNSTPLKLDEYTINYEINSVDVECGNE